MPAPRPEIATVAAAEFFDCLVTHRRFGKISHALCYHLFYLKMDLDQIPQATKQSFLLGTRWYHPIRFCAADHGAESPKDLAAWVRHYLASKNISEAADNVELICLPRIFGFVFNPIAIYLIHNRQGELHHILYQVSNTFHERHFYLVSCAKTAGDKREHWADKAFYVSPFFAIDGRYHFTLRSDRLHLGLKIIYHRHGQKALRAQLHGKAKQIDNTQCLKLLLRFPLMTLGVVMQIHWHALQLWFKGAKYHFRKKLHRLPRR